MSSVLSTSKSSLSFVSSQGECCAVLGNVEMADEISLGSRAIPTASTRMMRWVSDASMRKMR